MPARTAPSRGRSSAGYSPTGCRRRRRGPWPARTPAAGDVVLAYLWEQADAIRATDPRVRQNAPDSVHAMRVACRRMRSTLQSFRVVLDRERTDALVDELRWLAGQLGGARDLEVQEQRIGAAVGALPPELAMGPVAAQITRFFARRRRGRLATPRTRPWTATATSRCSTRSTRCWPTHR